MEAGSKLFEKNLRRFPFDKTVRVKYCGVKNIFEQVSRYPNKGKNFVVWRKDWPANKFFQIK